MPNIIDANGLQVKTQEELLIELTSALEAIYGSDINLDSDTPDGQQMNIYIQSTLDLQDLLVEVYNSFSPDSAIGKVLDQRVAINGIQRQAGTQTVTPITITNSQSVNLYGADQSIEPIYTVQDDAGTEWELITTVLGLAPAANILSFQSVDTGVVLTIPNTITNAITIVLGVDLINNPTTYTSLGIAEESDTELKIRRQKSVAISSQGYLDGLLAALENINGVISAEVRENNGSSTDVFGLPGHSIWVIISGAADQDDIATAIYNKRNAGCGTFGSLSKQVLQPDGTFFTIFYDLVVTEALFIQFNVTSLDGINEPNIDAIRKGLVTSFAPGVFEQVNINDLACEVQLIDPNALVTDAGFSLASGGPYTDTLIPTTPKNQFIVSEANTIILPMQMTPITVSLASLATQQFTVFGGFGAYIYSIPVDNSGASIDGAGLYTAGAGTGVDTVRATDALGNFIESTVTVS